MKNQITLAWMVSPLCTVVDETLLILLTVSAAEKVLK